MTDLTKTIYELELSLLKPEVRSSLDQLSVLLADDFIEFGSSGLIYDRKEILERLPVTNEKVEYVVSDFNAKELAEDVVLATFKTERTIDSKDKLTSLRSSLWRKNNNQWQMFFHQGTPIKQN